MPTACRQTTSTNPPLARGLFITVAALIVFRTQNHSYQRHPQVPKVDVQLGVPKGKVHRTRQLVGRKGEQGRKVS